MLREIKLQNCANFQFIKLLRRFCRREKTTTNPFFPRLSYLHTKIDKIVRVDDTSKINEVWMRYIFKNFCKAKHFFFHFFLPLRKYLKDSFLAWTLVKTILAPVERVVPILTSRLSYGKERLLYRMKFS